MIASGEDPEGTGVAWWHPSVPRGSFLSGSRWGVRPGFLVERQVH